MLALLLGLIVPLARKQNIELYTAIGLVVALWVCSLVAVRACFRARHRRYSYGWQQAYPRRTTPEDEKTAATTEPPV
jgi:uncharacterized protein YhhL (DUF1145 family)